MKNKTIIFQLRRLAVMAIFTFSLTAIAQENYGGLALYTLREEMEKDPEATLAKVSEIGYQYIEAAGYKDGKFYRMEPSIYKATMDKYKLNPLSSHHSSVSLENADAMMKDVKAAGFTYFVVPVPPRDIFTYDTEKNKMGYKGGAKNFAELLNALGKKAKEHGLQLLYHNHDFEFQKNEKGEILIDYLLENTDPDYVNYEMDLYWVSKTGADPVAYFEKYPGRFILWHVKDMDKKGNFAPVGEGNIDFKRILENKELSGMKYYFVEQDATYERTPLEAIKISHEALKEYGFDKI